MRGLSECSTVQVNGHLLYSETDPRMSLGSLADEPHRVRHVTQTPLYLGFLICKIIITPAFQGDPED